MTTHASITDRPSTSATPSDEAIGRMLSAPEPADREGVVETTPSDLAAACDWAVRQFIRLRDKSHTAGWSDEQWDEQHDRALAVYVRAIDETSHSLLDVQAKARLLLDDMAETGELDSAFINDRLGATILREVIALAPALTGATQAAALIAEIEREWPLMAAADSPGDRSSEAEAAFEEAYARRKVLLDAAEALPCTCREARHAKALALAWYEWAQLGLNTRREDGGPDDRLVFDIHTSLTTEA